MNVKLLVARKQADLTQDQLAAKAEISQADVSRIEKSGWIPPAEIRQRLATALDTTPDELFGMLDSIAAQRHA